MQRQAAASGRLPANQLLGVVDQDDIVLLEHRHENLFQFLLPQLAFIEPCLHRLTRGKVRETAHKEEDSRIVDREEWPEDLHPDFEV